LLTLRFFSITADPWRIDMLHQFSTFEFMAVLACQFHTNKIRRFVNRRDLPHCLECRRIS